MEVLEEPHFLLRISESKCHFLNGTRLWDLVPIVSSPGLSAPPDGFSCLMLTVLSASCSIQLLAFFKVEEETYVKTEGAFFCGQLIIEMVPFCCLSDYL